MIDRRLIGDEAFQTLYNKFLKRYPKRWRESRLSDEVLETNKDFKRPAEFDPTTRARDVTLDDDFIEQQAFDEEKDNPDPRVQVEREIFRDAPDPRTGLRTPVTTTKTQVDTDPAADDTRFPATETEEDQALAQSSASQQRPLRPGQNREEEVEKQRERLKKESIADAKERKKQAAFKKKRKAKKEAQKKAEEEGVVTQDDLVTPEEVAAAAEQEESSEIRRIKEEIANTELLIHDYKDGQFSGQPESDRSAAELEVILRMLNKQLRAHQNLEAKQRATKKKATKKKTKKKATKKKTTKKKTTKKKTKKKTTKKKTKKKTTKKKRTTRTADQRLTSDAKVEVFMRDPDGRRMAPGILRQDIKELAEYVGKFLSDNVKIRIINHSAAREMIRKGHEHAAIAEELLDHSRFAVKYNPDGPTYILVDDFQDVGMGMAALIHELGHVIHYDTWTDLTREEQDALWQAFVDDVQSGERTTGTNINREQFREQPEAAINIYEFKEWMADNFVDWMANRREPQTAMERFMEQVAEKWDQFWSFITNNPGRFNRLNQTYADFADAMAARIREDGVSTNTRFFTNEGAAGRPVHVLFDNGGQITPPGLVEQQWNGVQQRLDQYPRIARRANTLSEWMKTAYTMALSPSTSVMRSLEKAGITAAGKLANMFHRTDHGRPKLVRNYHQRVEFQKGVFMSKFKRIRDNMSDSEKTRLQRTLRAKDNTSETVTRSARERQVRRLMDEVHQYLIDAGLPVGRIPNYWPRMMSREKLIAGEADIIRYLVRRRRQRRPNESPSERLRNAREFYNSLISDEAASAAAQAELLSDELSMQMPGFRNMRSRTAEDSFFDAYLEDNFDNILSNYIVSAVKRAEYNRLLGQDAREIANLAEDNADVAVLSRDTWDGQKKLQEILDEARQEGATQEQLKTMKDYVDANLGMYGRDSVPDNVRTAMAGVVAYTNMRVLLFTVFASLPDMIGPMIRSGEIRGPLKTMMKNIKEAASSESELNEIAETWGIASNVANQHVLAEYVDNHYMPPQLRKWNDAFFKWTGLNFYTNFTRKMALAVGMETLTKEAGKVNDMSLTQRQRDKATQFLGEFGLTADMVNAWNANGRPIYGSQGHTVQSAVDEKVAEALVQFVDESILRPNPAQRPILASHPGAILVYHLKGYIYATQDIILTRLAHNYKVSRGTSETAAALAPAMLILLMTAIGMELRELVTGNRRTDGMDGLDYVANVAERSGLYGLAQLGFDFAGAGARGQSELAALGTPALGQLGDLISKPVSQTIPQAIPVMSQLPWARDALREATPL
jgi:hypothetical protein